MARKISGPISAKNKNEPSGDPKITEGFPRQRLTLLPNRVIRRCQSLPVTRQLHPTHLGIYPTAPHHYVDRPHGTQQHILIYCLEGRGRLRLNHTEHTVTPGQALVIPARQPHVYQADAQDPWSIFWIHFSGIASDEIVQAMGTTINHPMLDASDHHTMRRAFEELYACLKYNYSDPGLMAMSGELMRLLGKLKLAAAGHQAARDSSNDRVQAAVSFMEQHLDMTLTLEEIAAQAGLAPVQFSKLFRNRTNQSPVAYFIQLKIRRACELLHETDESVASIAKHVGYNDPYHFSRLFKKVQGCAPSHYRQRLHI